MAIQPLNFPRFSFDELNPLMTGYGKGLDFSNTMSDIISKNLEQQKSRAQLPYVGPQAQANLQKTQLENKFYPSKTQAEIELEKAQAGYYGKEAQTKAFLLNNPLFMNPEAAMLSLRLTGRIPNTSIPGLNGQTPNAGSMGGGGTPNAMQPNTPNATAPSQPGAALSGSDIPAFISKYFQSPAENAANVEEAKQNVLNYNKKADEANSQATNANVMNQYISQFLENYNKSRFKGTGIMGGNIPSSGLKNAPFSMFHDFTPEQLTDQASQNIQSLLIPTLHTNKLTNYELQFLSGLKLNRSMEKNAVNDISNYYQAANNRVAEFPQFLTSAKAKGLNPQESETLFNMYKTQRPIIDVATRKINDEFANTWKDYLTKDAITSLRTSGTYEPPISDADIKHTARVHNMKEADVRKMLKDQGRLK